MPAEQPTAAPSRLAGVFEVADLLGVSRAALADQRKHADFPEPIATLRCGPIWDMTQIEDYASRRRQDPRANYRWSNQPGRWERHFRRHPPRQASPQR